MNPFPNEPELPESELKLHEQSTIAQRQKLDEVVIGILLCSSKDDVYNILPMADYRLRTFRLRHVYEPREIFLEAYRRAVKTIEAGQEIYNIPAWFRTTIFNIIREYSKLKDNHHAPMPQGKDFPASEHSYETIEHEFDVRWLLEAIERIDPEDKKIICLRMKGLTYKQMSAQFNLSEETLRQKFHRALEKLRKMYPR
ncbi:sigma-70 family RNA polymerase sigma factor [Phormidium tenue FACHB-886]|nr:sigma-70 family RNA polymerase sigma factor [Phormidium tenue FACHB-886]